LAHGDEHRAAPRPSTEFAAPKTRRLAVKAGALLELVFRRLDADPSAPPDVLYSEQKLLKRLRAIDRNLGV